MGRRAKRALPETYLRQRLESVLSSNGMKSPRMEGGKIRMRRATAPQEWAKVVFKAKHGRYPTDIELCQAIDSGVVGAWIEEQYKPRDIQDRVIVVGKREIPYEEFTAKTKPALDSSFRENEERIRRERREKRWRDNAEQSVIQDVIAGVLKGLDAQGMEAEASKRVDKARNDWEIEQIFARADKAHKRRERRK